MVLPRIWLSCAADGNDQQEVALMLQLISALRNAGAEVVSESAALPDEQFLAFLQRELAACQWFILVQTSHGMRSEREQLVLQKARFYHEEGSLRGAFLVSASLDGLEEPVPWPEMKSYVYTGI